MAQITDKSSAFTIIASALAVSLIAAAAVLFLQSGNSSSSGGSAPALAAVSQAIPLHTSSALSGDSEGFDHLTADVERLAGLRQNTSTLGLPGGAAAWDELERHARAVLAQRTNIESITGAARLVNDRMPRLLSASDALLDVSGATAVVQELQRRGAEVQSGLTGLATSGTAAATAQAISDDMAYLRSVTDALSGLSSTVDVAALDDATREATLIPVTTQLADIEAQVSAAVAAAGNIDDLGGAIVGVNNVASTLLSSAFSSSGSTARWHIG